MRQARSTAEGAFLAALTVVFYLSSIYIPILGFLLSFLCPLPVMFLTIRWDMRAGLLAALVASFIVFIFAGVVSALTCFVGFTLLGLIMGLTIKRGYNFIEVIGINTLVSISSKLLLIGLVILIMGQNPLAESLSFLEEGLKKGLSFLPSEGGINVEDIINLIRMALPATVIVASILDTVLNFLLGGWIGKRLGIKFPPFPPFGEWQLPKSIFWAFALGWLFVLFGGTTFWGKIGLNLQMVTQILFLVQGASVVYYFLGKYIRSRVWLTIIVIFLALQPLLSTILSWLGVFDVWFDLRKIRGK
ncbi:MAG TPA: YybS family protein [Candidatus Atribacteria bacterium]|nr:YybS family protein [Candidatus Atribacteria bacterium]